MCFKGVMPQENTGYKNTPGNVVKFIWLISMLFHSRAIIKASLNYGRDMKKCYKQAEF